MIKFLFLEIAQVVHIFIGIVQKYVEINLLMSWNVICNQGLCMMDVQIFALLKRISNVLLIQQLTEVFVLMRGISRYH